MKIEQSMRLDALCERMGGDATEQEARAMRNILIDRGYEGRDTSEIEESEWLRLVSDAVIFADHG